MLWRVTPSYPVTQQSTPRVPLIAAQFNEGKLRTIIHDGKLFDALIRGLVETASGWITSVTPAPEAP